MDNLRISDAIEAMISFFRGSLHDINHFIKVWGYAKLIGEKEGLDETALYILELAAITHDIACPACRAKYGSAIAERQEEEGALMVRDFLKPFSLASSVVDRISYLVGHHHTFDNIDGLDYQILVEADLIVNAEEKGFSLDNVKNTRDKLFRTKSGIAILNSIYGF